MDSRQSHRRYHRADGLVIKRSVGDGWVVVALSKSNKPHRDGGGEDGGDVQWKEFDLLTCLCVVKCAVNSRWPKDAGSGRAICWDSSLGTGLSVK